MEEVKTAIKEAKTALVEVVKSLKGLSSVAPPDEEEETTTDGNTSTDDTGNEADSGSDEVSE